jgi:hypothetical protein
LQVQVLPGAPKWTHPEPHTAPVDQRLRYEQRDKVAALPLAELSIDLDRNGRDDFFYIPGISQQSNIDI